MKATNWTEVLIISSTALLALVLVLNLFALLLKSLQKKRPDRFPRSEPVRSVAQLITKSAPPAAQPK